MKTIVTTKYQCEVCKRKWSDAATALACEHSGPPRLQVGDVVLWRGARDYDPQTVVYDIVAEVSVEYPFNTPGHEPYYRLSKQAGFDEREITDPRTGYVNIEHRLGRSGHLSDRVEQAMNAGEIESVKPVVDFLRRAGVAVQERASVLYKELRELEYGLTWSSLGTSFLKVYLPADQAAALAFLSADPTDAECLGYVGRRKFVKDKGYQPAEHLGGAFDYNHFTHGWGALVNYDLGAAFNLLAFSDEAGIVQRVRAYRAAVLAGEAPAPLALGQLFPLRKDIAGRWPAEVLAWAKAQGVTGGGATKLHRAHEAACRRPDTINPREFVDTQKVEKVMVKTMELWPGKRVIAVLAGKGGVGKSTVAVEIARALARSGRKVLAFDTDFYGPSFPALLPVEESRYRTEAGRILPHPIEPNLEAFSMGWLLGQDEPLDWRGVYLEPTFHMLASALKTDAEIVVLDMPPGTGDAVQMVTTLVPQVLFAFVAQAGPVALADVRRAISMLSSQERQRVAGIVENMAYLETAGGERVRLFGAETDVPQVAGEFSLRFLGSIPMTPSAEKRAEAVQALLLTPILDVLAGKRFQDVQNAPALIEAALDAYLARLAEQNSVGFRQVFPISSLVSFLHYPIVARGGNPDDPQYRAPLAAALERLLAHERVAANREPSVPGPHNGAWWAEFEPAQAVSAEDDEEDAEPVESAGDEEEEDEE